MNLNWATVIDEMLKDPTRVDVIDWAENEIGFGRGTPGQHRAIKVIRSGADISEFLGRTPNVLNEMLQATSPVQWRCNPEPSEWNAIQIVHHLADNESVNAVRIRSVLTEDTPEIFGYDSDPWTRFFSIEPIMDALERFRVCRRNTLALMGNLTEADKSKQGILSYRGAESLRVLLAVLAGHDLDHIWQLGDVLELQRSDFGVDI